MRVLIKIIVVKRVAAGKRHIKTLATWKASGIRRNGVLVIYFRIMLHNKPLQNSKLLRIYSCL